MNTIPEETSKRVCNHMNKDHKDAIKKYLRYYGKILNFKDAELNEIQSTHMKIKYDNKEVIINFEKEISEEEIHKTLVTMIKNIDSNQEY